MRALFQMMVTKSDLKEFWGVVSGYATGLFEYNSNAFES